MIDVAPKLPVVCIDGVHCELCCGGGGLEEGEGQTLCAGGQQCQPALTSPKSTAASKLKAEVAKK